MKTAVNVVGFLLMLVGLVWILQGIGILPGSFMSGQTKWAVIGAVTDLVGALVLVLNRRIRTDA